MKKAPYEKQDWCTTVSRLLKKIVAQCTVIVTDLVFFGLQKTLHISVSQKLTFSTNFLPDLLTLFSYFHIFGLLSDVWVFYKFGLQSWQIKFSVLNILAKQPFYFWTSNQEAMIIIARSNYTMVSFTVGIRKSGFRMVDHASVFKWSGFWMV